MKNRIIKLILLTLAFLLCTALLIGSIFHRFYPRTSSETTPPLNPPLVTHYSEKSALDASQKFDALTTTLIPSIIKASPLSASFMYRDLKTLGLEDLSKELDQVDDTHFNAETTLARTTLSKLNLIDYELLDEEQKATYDQLTFLNCLVLEGEPYAYYANMLEPSSGIHMNLLLSLIQIELTDASDVDAYLARLEQIPRLFDQVDVYELKRSSAHITLPKELYQTVLDQIDGLMVPPEDFILYLDFKKKLDEIQEIPSENKKHYLSQCLTLVQDDLYPAYQELRKTVEQLMSASNSTLGVNSWPNGKAYYQYLIHRETSYNMSPEDLRIWATKQKEICLAEIKAILKNNPELLKVDLAQALPKYTSLEDLYAVEDQCLKDQFYAYDIDRATEYIIPAYLEDYVAAGFYFPISIDGTGYGNMYLQEAAYTNINTSTLELYFHENIPGHHFYFSRFYQSDLPMIRKVSHWLPYEEGWAQYVQNMSVDYFGLSDALTKLLKASSQLSYYSMVLIDLNYHYDGISENQAIEAYMNLGFSKTAANKAVYRMIGNPGEIIHYIYGFYKMQGYLTQCQAALGDAFDIKAFHEMILIHAELPFTIMDQIVDRYIKDNTP